MTNQFDLEQQILSCWHVTDDLKLVYDAVIEGNMSNDDIANALLGMQTVYNLKFDQCFKTFEEFLKEVYTK